MDSKNKKRKISINFTDEYIDVYSFLKTQPNISNYICKTIKLQMVNESEDYINKKIREAIQELLGDVPIPIILSNNPQVPPKPTK